MEGMDWLNFIQLIAIPAFAALWFYINKTADKITERLDKHVEKSSDDLETVRKGVGEWQLFVVRDYATRAELERLENRIVGAIERLEAKLDKKLDLVISRGEE